MPIAAALLLRAAARSGDFRWRRAEAEQSMALITNLPALAVSSQRMGTRSIFMRLWAAMTTAVICAIVAGCISISSHRGYPPPSVVYVPVPEGTSNQEATATDLKARLDAAETISSFVERDAAMASIAGTAAQCSDVEATRKALSKISAFTTHDAATETAALILAKRGHRPEAIELAKTISAFTTRDRALKRLALE